MSSTACREYLSTDNHALFLSESLSPILSIRDFLGSILHHTNMLRLWMNQHVKTCTGEYKPKMTQLSSFLPRNSAAVGESLLLDLDKITRSLPWALTYSDLSDMRIPVDLDKDHLTGVINRVNASNRPFCVALWDIGECA